MAHGLQAVAVLHGLWPFSAQECIRTDVISYQQQRADSASSASSSSPLVPPANANSNASLSQRGFWQSFETKREGLGMILRTNSLQIYGPLFVSRRCIFISCVKCSGNYRLHSHSRVVLPNKRVIHQLNRSGARSWITSQAPQQEILPFIWQVVRDFRFICISANLEYCCYLQDKIREEDSASLITVIAAVEREHTGSNPCKGCFPIAISTTVHPKLQMSADRL